MHTTSTRRLPRFHVEHALASRRLRPWSILALVLVPLLAVGLLLGTAWGRDQRLHRVSAAVVNNDKAVKVKGQTVPMGRQLAAQITTRQDDNIAWTLSDPADGAAGLASGKYAVVVTIPENFSAAATSMASADKAQQATIDIATSPAAAVEDAAIAKQIADIATQGLNQTLTSGYLDNVYIGFNTMGQQLTTMANGARQLSTGAGSLRSGITQASSGTSQLADGLQQLDSNGGKLTSGGAQLGSGASTLADGVSAYTSGTSQVVGGISQLSAGISKLDAGLAGASTSAQFGQLGQLKTGAAQVATGAAGLSRGLDAYQAQLDAWASGRSPMPQQVQQAFTTQSAQQCATQVQQAVAQANSAELKQQLNQAVDAQLQKIQPQLQQTASKLNLTPEQTKQLQDQTEQAIRNAIDQANLTPQLSSTIRQQVTTTVCPQVTKLVEPAFRGGFQAGTATASAALDHKDASSGQSLHSGARALASGAAQLSTGVATLVDQLPRQIAAQMATLKSAVAQLDQGGKTLATKSQALVSGGEQLSAGAAQLSSGITTYTDGVTKYTDGVHQANTGAQKLASGMTQLDSGAGKLATGLDTFATKVSQGATKVPSYTAEQRDRLSTVVSAPVTGGRDGVTSPLTQLTSLLLVLAAWLGALATWLVIRPLASRTLTSSRPSWQIAGATMVPGALVALAQAVLLGTLGAVVLHLGFTRGLGLVGFLALAGLCFTAVNHALAAWLGGGGRVLALVLAVVTAAVGIVSAVPGWFTAIHDATPLAPALTGVRDIVAHRTIGVGPIGSLVVVGLVAALLVLYAVVRRRRLTADRFRAADPASLR